MEDSQRRRALPDIHMPAAAQVSRAANHNAPGRPLQLGAHQDPAPGASWHPHASGRSGEPCGEP